MQRVNKDGLNLEKENINIIKKTFPEAVENGKINFNMLRAILGDEIDESKEKYQFSWKGKAKSIKIAQTPSTATLRPCEDKSKNWDTTENLYIEGDNLEVLKQLQKTYYGKIKMIYIDPPYNTGNDFVYNDSFSNSLENYKEQTNQSASSNPESNGRFHTDWLNMMYPRLLLARKLLTDDGVIFISIDDKEVGNLRKICDEIFGENNFINDLIWQKKFSRANDATYFSTMHDHILCYCKENILSSSNGWKIGLLPRGDEIPDGYSNPDNDERGVWTSVVLSAKSGSESLAYEITTPSGRKVFPPSGRFWSCNKDTFEKWKADNRIWFGKNGDGMPRKKTFLSEVQNGLRPNTILFHELAGHNQEAKQETKALFNGIGMFDGPKPVRLIKLLLNIANLKLNDLILDFFSGSATTAHAVMKLNAEDGGNRKFIMVQLPELCNEKSEAHKAGYKNICEIGEERIRRAGEQIKVEWEKEHSSDGLLGTDEEFTTDIGFKVFKLDSTNVNEWDPNMKLDEKELAIRLGEVFKEGRRKEDILYEIMLKYGVFDKQVEEIDVNGKTMYRVGKRYMIVCLEDCITSEDVKAIAELSPRTVIFNEAGFMDDNSKINAVYNLEKSGVEDIKCI
ncbi:site-specific DNA-methyltransferase [uncultured Holdemanella sp.]|uniref:site-specific DNA-methyltransferase n=1 Tax=uncultured Holdemanella sp. TaxID=1763549 RepID=UPI0025E75A15|nr:site-specific DNA-methyltransferase [uncultured Holdemanella sp.]